MQYGFQRPEFLAAATSEDWELLGPHTGGVLILSETRKKNAQQEALGRASRGSGGELQSSLNSC